MNPQSLLSDDEIKEYGVGHALSPDSVPAIVEEEVNSNGAVVDIAEAKYAMQTNFNFLSALVSGIPEEDFLMWPEVFLAAFAMIADASIKVRDFSKFAFGFPRGFAKTSFIKLVLVWIVLFTRKSFILIVGSNSRKAERILMDVWSMLQDDNVKAIFGDVTTVVEVDRNDEKQFYINGRKVVLLALGKGGSVRGLLQSNNRPDCMVFDDIQEKEEAKSEVEYNNLLDWFFSTALKATSPKGCLFLFLANMYPTEFSLLRKLQGLKAWTKFITGAIRADGSSLWEELQPIKQLLEEYQQDKEAGLEAIFLAEKMNDPHAQVSNFLDKDRVQLFRTSVDDYHVGGFILIDPSAGKKKSDDLTIEAYLLFDGVPVLREIKYDKYNPKETIKVATAMAIKYRLGLIVVEDVAYQSTLAFWFQEVWNDEGIEGLSVGLIGSGNISKNARILTSFKALMAGEWRLHEDCEALYFDQAFAFDPLKTNNRDDIIDPPGYLSKVMADPELRGRMMSYNVYDAESERLLILDNFPA